MFKVNFVRARTVNMLAKDDVTLGSLTVPEQDFGEVVECWGDAALFSVFQHSLITRNVILESWDCHFQA